MKDNNKGFSFVEMVIVIAIMAILAAALAPQLIKYIDRSRKSVDTNNCQAIITNLNAILSETDVYEEVMGTDTGGTIYIKFTIDGHEPDDYVGSVSGGKFEKRFEDIMNGDWRSVSQSKDMVYGVTIEIDNNNKRVEDVKVDVVDRD